VLAFPAEQVQDAAELGIAIFPADQKAPVGVIPEPGAEPLLTADEAAELTSVPKQWLLEAARKREVPHYRLGKYVRFRLSELADNGRVKAGRRLEAVR